MRSLCLQYGEVTAIKTYSSWAQAIDIVSRYLKMLYPNIKQWEFENVMLQLEEHPYILYKDFYVDLS